jgi:hypothetical protein
MGGKRAAALLTSWSAMATYSPINPERPLRRAAVAVAVSLGVHAALLLLLASIGLAAIIAARKREAERPKEVALAAIDAARWEENRAVAGRIAKVEPTRAEELTSRMALSPGTPGRRPPDGRASSEAPAPTPGPDASGPAQPGSTLDLEARPIPNRSVAMKFDPVGTGGTPYTEGTGFGSFRVLNPEAWRFANFFGRAVEAMDAVYRYELGAPMPPSLHAQWLNNPRRGGGCSWTFVRLDAAGRVLDARVRRSSGMPDLDALIVEVIRRSAPLANLPTGLLDANGIYADSWGLCITWGDYGG